jgi:hypothetical protein
LVFGSYGRAAARSVRLNLLALGNRVLGAAMSLGFLPAPKFGALKLLAPPIILTPPELVAANPHAFACLNEQLRISNGAYLREWDRFYGQYVFAKSVRLTGNAHSLGSNIPEAEIEAVRAAGGRPALYELLLGQIEADACRIQLVDWDDLERDIERRGVLKAVLGDEILAEIGA